jgi:NADPH:quinone reductase-like Zn-dependent oxidoreductase
MGGFAEYAVIPSRNTFKIGEDMSWETAASIPISALTAYHALVQSKVRSGESVVIIGASGNTGMFAVQLAKMMGAKVIAVSRKKWIEEFGATLCVGIDQVQYKVNEITDGRMADVVVDPLGSKTFEVSFGLLGLSGRLVTFGTLTGGNAMLPLSKLYSKQISVIGTTGGTRREMTNIIENHKRLKVRVWKKFNLDDIRSAIEALSSSERSGRIFLEV